MNEPQIVDQVRSRIDIVDLIGEYLELKRRGANYLGLCPFHTEKTPSFTVNYEKQIFHCFGCGSGGDVFTFLMLRENLNFPEALERLAERAGISLPQKPESPEQSKVRSLKERGMALNRRAADLFFQCLQEDPRADVAREYLHKRGISEAMIQAFGLGYALNSWSFLSDMLIKEGYTPQDLELFGLAIGRENRDGVYDRFRHRVMFPIFDARGRVVAFGGRVLDDSVPKYLNSPETQVYTKGLHLYGLHRAGPEIRSKGISVLVEGYMDVIACHQQGIGQAVASLGTALTKEQGRMLLRYAPQVTIVYDSDQAGTEAAVRAGKVLIGLGARVRIATLQGAKDPDEYVSKYGQSAFWNLCEQAPSYFNHRFNSVSQGKTLDSVAGKVAVVQELISDLLLYPSPVEQEANLQWLSRQIRLSEESIWAELKGKHQQGIKSNRLGNKKEENRQNNPASFIQNFHGQSTEHAKEDRVERAIRFILWHCLNNTVRWTEFITKIPLNKLNLAGHLGTLFKYLYSLAENEETLSTNNLSDLIKDPELKSYLTALLVEDYTFWDKEAAWNDCLEILRIAILMQEINSIQAQVESFSQSGEIEQMQRLLPRLMNLMKEKDKAAKSYGTVPIARVNG